MKKVFTNRLFAMLVMAGIFFANNVRAQYCTPSFNQGCTYGTGIETFMLTGVASSINDPATGCSAPLTYYLDHTSMSVTMAQGGTYTASANNNTSPLPFPISGVKALQIWIDFNNDFTFSSTEIVGGFSPMTTSLASFSINIPVTATTGTHRMRVVASADFASYSLIPPCPTAITVVHGEVHDYTAVITGLSTACAPVTGLSASSITSTTATISWTAVTGAIGYEWAVTTSATPPASGTLTTLTTASPTGLTPSTVYYAHVRTKCSATSFSTWTTYTFTTSGSTTTCPPVTGLTMSSITASSAILSWTAATGAVGYEWAVTTSATPPASGTATTLTTATASGLTAATVYYAHVRTNCGTSFSTWVTTTFTTSPSTSSCPSITGLAASSITTTSATVSWTAVTSGSLGYQYVIDNIVTAPTGSGTNTTVTSTSPTGLTPGTTYYAHVRDSCGSGSFSPWTTIPFTTLSSTCNAPTGLAASAITSNSATISWTNATGAVGAQYVVNTIAADPTTSGTPTTATSIPITGLTAATTYYAHVRDSCGATALSAWVTIPFTTLGSTGVGYINGGNSPFYVAAYPNPVKDELTITVHGNIAGNARVQVMDITGKLIKTVNADAGTITIQMDSLPQGIYLVRYIDAEHNLTLKADKE